MKLWGTWGGKRNQHELNIPQDMEEEMFLCQVSQPVSVLAAFEPLSQRGRRNARKGKWETRS